MRSGGANEGQAGLKKGPWTPAEDAILLEYVRKHGEGNWNAVQKNSGLSRCGKSCRLRWANHLRPNLKKGAFSPEEELLILRLHAQLGNKWARMAAHLPGRTDNEIKNYWNTRIKRRQRAGLPLYPSDIQRHSALNQTHHHHPHPTTPPPLSPASPTNFSLLDPFGFPSRPRYHLPLSTSMPDLPRIKRIRDDNIGFQLNFSASQPPPLFQPPTPPSQQAFQYSMGSFEVDPVKMEISSTQLYGEGAGSAGGVGLLDAMLQETLNGGEMVRGCSGMDGSAGEHEMKWVQLVNGGGGEVEKGEVEEGGDKCDEDEPANGKKNKSELVAQETNHVSEELSALLDMIPTTSMPPPTSMGVSDWCNNDSGVMSNGPSSVITDEDMGLDMQHLASSISMGAEGQEWNLGPCPWSPGIC